MAAVQRASGNRSERTTIIVVALAAAGLALQYVSYKRGAAHQSPIIPILVPPSGAGDTASTDASGSQGSGGSAPANSPTPAVTPAGVPTVAPNVGGGYTLGSPQGTIPWTTPAQVGGYGSYQGGTLQLGPVPTPAGAVGGLPATAPGAVAGGGGPR